MPIAKLSRKFYETFGDDLTTELVDYLNAVEAGYRSELRDLFEAHFGRFDAKLEREIAGLDAKLEQRTAEIRTEIAGLGAKLEQRIAEVRREIAEFRGELRAEFHKDIGSVKADLIKWNFAFWVPVRILISSAIPSIIPLRTKWPSSAVACVGSPKAPD